MDICRKMLYVLVTALLLIGCNTSPDETPEAEENEVTYLEELGEHPDTDVPYVPTPQKVVDKMLEVAQVTENDTVYDLGSGDGRIVIAAAEQYGAHGVGIDINPARIKEARRNAEEAGVSDLVTFREGDIFEMDLSEATVVTLYLLPDVNRRLRPKLFRELRPGTPVVSHDFDMGEWRPERRIDIDASAIFLWTIPEDVPARLMEEVESQ